MKFWLTDCIGPAFPSLSMPRMQSLGMNKDISSSKIFSRPTSFVSFWDTKWFQWFHHCFLPWFRAVLTHLKREEVMIKQISLHANQSCDSAMRKSQQSWSFGHQGTFKNSICEVPWGSQCPATCWRHLAEWTEIACFTLLKKVCAGQAQEYF